MKERPILFSGEMVRAILDGRKTMTRRTLSDKLIFNVNPDRYRFLGFNDDGEALFEDLQPEITQWISPVKCPYGKVGDRLYVKETYLNHALDGHEPVYMYKADGDDKPHDRKWKSGRFMPKVASRINLEITGVRVERLQEISETDAHTEGVQESCYLELTEIPESMLSKLTFPHECYRYGFGVTWDKINGKKHPWASNPWVWVVEFKVAA